MDGVGSGSSADPGTGALRRRGLHHGSHGHGDDRAASLNPAALLKPGGRFVFSVAHPVFNSGTACQTAERWDRDGALVTEFGVRVTRYLEPYAHMGVGIPGQPQPQHYSTGMSLLFNTCFKYGFVLDRMEEPGFSRRT